MKALEMIRAYYPEWDNHALVVYIRVQDMKEIIAELEAMQSRSCESCKYVTNIPFDRLICQKGQVNTPMLDRETPKDFYCKYHERKEDE